MGNIKLTAGNAEQVLRDAIMEYTREKSFCSLAKKTGISSRTIMDCAYGNHHISIGRAETIANAIGYELKLVKKEMRSR